MIIDDTMIATAPGKLILTGEYAVLDGAPALVIAVNRRATARIRAGAPRGSSPFLIAVAEEIAARRGANDPAAAAAFEIAVDSTPFYDGLTKLGLGSSAAVTVAATALAFGATGCELDRAEVLAIASAAHAKAQGTRGARGSGADIAAAVHGGAIVFKAGAVTRHRWPTAVRLIPFFTGAAADTAQLVAQVAEARRANPNEVEAALKGIESASMAACASLAAPKDLVVRALIGALALGAAAFDRLAIATKIPLVPGCVTSARSAMSQFGGTAKTTGAGGGDIGIAAIPASEDVSAATRSLIEAGCRPLQLSVDEGGVDLRPSAS